MSHCNPPASAITTRTSTWDPNQYTHRWKIGRWKIDEKLIQSRRRPQISSKQVQHLQCNQLQALSLKTATRSMALHSCHPSVSPISLPSHRTPTQDNHRLGHIRMLPIAPLSNRALVDKIVAMQS